MKRLTIVILALGAISLAACRSSRDGGNSDQNNEFNDSAKPSATPRGEFKSLGSSDQKTIDQIRSCTGSMHFETRLKVGQTFDFFQKASKVGGGFMGSGHVKINITAADAATNSFSYNETFLPLSNTPIVIQSKCKLGSPNVYETKCEYTMGGQPLKLGDGSDPDVEKYCYVTDEANGSAVKSNETYELGTYVMSNGFTTTAVRTVTNKEGRILCTGKDGKTDEDQGHGTMVMIEIQSADIPAYVGYTCGAGTTVFSYSEITQANGTSAFVNKSEIISFK